MTDSLIDIANGRIFVQKWTPEKVLDATPLFLLHDSLGSTELWRDFPAKLSQELGRIVFSYDRLGFGKSTKREELPSLRFVDEEAEIYFPQILKALNVQSFDLFGHSVGGGMAVAIAAHVPGCRSVVTESSQAFVEELTKSGIEKAKRGFRDPKSFDRLAKYHGDKARWVLSAWTDVWLSQGFAKWSLGHLLPDVKCPLLAIHGDHDDYGSAAFPKYIVDHSGGPARMEMIPDCGHVPHREKPDLIIKLLREFYQSI